jgi:ATP-dependent helicase HrpB
MIGFFDRISRVRGDDVVTVAGETWRMGSEAKKGWDERRSYGLVLDVNGVSQFVTQLIALEEEWLMPLGIWEESTFFDETRKVMVKRSTLKIGTLTLQTKDEVQKGVELQDSDPLRRAVKDWLEAFRHSPKYRRWELFSQTQFPEKQLNDFEWELFVEEFLLSPRLPSEVVQREFEQRLNDELQLYFDSTFGQQLNDVIPTHYRLHEKRNCEIMFEPGKPPAIEAFIQDFYGRGEQPTIAGGRLKLTVRLCGPHRRPEQITGDLAGFWKNTYPALSRELKRDYPRHFWPEDPARAEPKLHTNPRPPRH